jgi:hypothetical protein
MWFDDSMDEVYDEAIKPAISEAGYNPLRIDRVEHANRIDDEIIGRIKGSRFMVADFTGQRAAPIPAPFEHLNRPVDAMRAIHAALRPGGVMVCEEADVSAVYAEPASAAYTELRDICMEGARQRGVDYSGGRRAHLWAKEAGFEIVHVDAYHPHYVTGEHKGFWNWTLRAVALGMVKEGSLSAARLEELVAGMNEADASPDTLVAHCRMHQLIAKKTYMRV